MRESQQRRNGPTLTVVDPLRLSYHSDTRQQQSESTRAAAHPEHHAC